MNNDELKKKIADIIYHTGCTGACCECDYSKYSDADTYCKAMLKASALIEAGIGDVKEVYRELTRIEVLKQERFAEEHGFTPDCTPYYIAEQYKLRAEVEEEQVKTYRKIIEKIEKNSWNRLHLYRVIVNKSPTYDEVEEYICAAKSEENARLLSEYCKGDVNKPKEDFQVQHIGVSDNDSFEEIVCEVVNWF